jgi:hypothetical protein
MPPPAAFQAPATRYRRFRFFFFTEMPIEDGFPRLPSPLSAIHSATLRRRAATMLEMAHITYYAAAMMLSRLLLPDIDYRFCAAHMPAAMPCHLLSSVKAPFIARNS